MSHMASPRADEMNLARLAVALVREFGGVLEHPAHSKLWPAQRLPDPGQRDAWGGFTLPLNQQWFGHRAEKATFLYVVGCEPRDVPPMPYSMGEATHVIASSTARQRRTHAGWRPEVTRSEREQTTPQLADWLVELARRCAAAEVA